MGENIRIHRSSKLYGRTSVGEGTVIMENVTLGYPEHRVLMEIIKQGIEIEDHEYPGTTVEGTLSSVLVLPYSVT